MTARKKPAAIGRIGSVLLAAFVSAATVIGTGGVGHAAPAPAPATGAGAAAADCPFTGTLCLFDGVNYTGERFAVSSLDPNGTCVSLVDHGWGDRARSALNTNGRSAAMFFNDGCLGDPYQVPAGGGVPDFGSFRPASVWVP